MPFRLFWRRAFYFKGNRNIVSVSVFESIPLWNKKEWYRGRSLSSLMLRRKGFLFVSLRSIALGGVNNELEKIQEISCNENGKKNVA